MKKIISFILFLIFFAGTGYSAEILLNYKYNKKEPKRTPIESVKVTKNNNEYKISYKIKGVVSNYSNKEIPIDLPFSYSDKITIKKDSSFSINGSYSFKCDYDNKNIKFSFVFDDYNNTIESKKSSLRNADTIFVINPARITYQYNEQENTFDVIQTIIYVSENGELTTKDIEITDTASDTISLKSGTLSTDYYIRLREEEERIAEEKIKIGLEERRKLEEEERIAKEKEEKIAKEKKEKKLFTITQKMKNWQDVSKYTEEDIKEAFELHFNAIIYDQYSSNRAISNIEKNKNIYYQPIKIFQIVPNKGILGEVVTNTFFIGGGAFVRTKPYIVYIEYKNTKDFIDDQLIEVYAKITGTFSYQNTFGGTMTVPKLKAYLVKKIKSYY